MKRIKLSYTETIYKKDENGNILFDDNGNGIIETSVTQDFNLTLDIDENITIKQMNTINKCFSGMKEGEEIEGLIKMLEEFATEKENIKFIDKLNMAEFTKLNSFIAEALQNINKSAEKKIAK